METVALLWITSALIGLGWDSLVGDPHDKPHPARWVGRLVRSLESRLRRHLPQRLRLAGVLLCGGTVAAVGLAHLLLLGLLLALDYSLWQAGVWTGAPCAAGLRSWPWATVFGTGLVNGVWFSWRSLADEAGHIQGLLEHGNLEAGRRALSLIVGRDTAALSPAGVARATVETIGENSVDGGIAPLFWALVGGPVGVAVYKAASTLDSMVGYRSPRYREMGAVSARLDDILAYLPARLAILLVPCGARLGGLDAPGAFRTALRDGGKHPSPNSAIGESLFAGALGVCLGGPSTYGGIPAQKPLLGQGEPPRGAADIARARGLLRSTQRVAALLLATGLPLLLWVR